MTKSCQHKVDLGRRQFLRGSGVIAAAGVATAVGATAAKADVPLARVRDRKSTRLNSSHIQKSRMPSSA